MSADSTTDLHEAFLSAMSCAANTVYIVTTDGPAGKAGLTVTALSSVSADVDAPRLLICLHHDSGTAQIIRANGGFCVNMLGEADDALSDRFAGRHGDEIDRFAQGDWGVSRAGMPVLESAVAVFDCALSEETLVGTHHVLFGAVREARSAPEEAPLLYHKRSYAKTAS